MFLRQCMRCQIPLCFFFALASNFNTLRPRMVPSARLASVWSASTVLAPMISEATSGTYQKDSPAPDESLAIRNGQPNHMKAPLGCSCPSQDQKKILSCAVGRLCPVSHGTTSCAYRITEASFHDIWSVMLFYVTGDAV